MLPAATAPAAGPTPSRALPSPQQVMALPPRDPHCRFPPLQTAETSQLGRGGKRGGVDTSHNINVQEPSGLSNLRHRISLPNRLIHIFINRQVLDIPNFSEITLKD